ncbi:MAG: BMP family ABC transporter substrate-binding protein, partial [Chloroflexota bacterium]
MKARFFTLSLVLVALLMVLSAGITHTPQVSAATMEGTEAAMPAITKQIKIAVVAPSAKNDLAWTQSIYDGLVAVQTAVGGKDKLDFTVSENLFNVPDAAAAIRDYATQGYDIVIAHGTQYGASMFDVAKDFPDVSFAWGTATDTGESQGLKNVLTKTSAKWIG